MISFKIKHALTRYKLLEIESGRSYSKKYKELNTFL